MTTDDGPRQGQDAGVGAVMGERRRLVNLAYRLLGSLAEAEDAVQETYVRWYGLSERQRDAVRSPGAWLTTVAGRICFDVLGSARVRRERHVGAWIPEPLPDGTEWVTGPDGIGGDPADRITLDESVTMAFLVALESMTPAERVALILHDVFGYSFPEVGRVIGRKPAACRQLASSARIRARTFEASPAAATRRTRTVRAFKEAWEARDIDALLELLDPDATAVADSGGLSLAAPGPIEGAGRVAHHYAAIAGKMPDTVAVLECVVNGQPGLAVQQEGVTVTVLAFDVVGDRIRRIWTVLDPDKLRRWADGHPADNGAAPT